MDKNPFPETVSVNPIVQRLLPGYGASKEEQLAIEKAISGSRTQYNSEFPPIYRGFHWGVVEPEKRVNIPYPTLESIGPYLWESCPGYKDTTDSGSRSSLATEEPVFGQLLAKLAQLVDRIQPIEVNNPDQIHGRGLSSFPLGSLPSVLTHLPSRRLRPIGIAQVQRGGGFYYLIYMSFQKRIILLYDRQLCAMSEEELAEFLYTYSYSPDYWQEEEEERFSIGEIIGTNIRRPLASPAELCAWCLLKMKEGIRLWNAYKLLAVNSGKISLQKHFDDHEENLFYIASRLLRKGQVRFAGDKMLERPLR
ncbi:hypothetical protein [Hymenobacter swuensis]|uniref:hypothetical protein n=1 Tax=Hymenobacter swuensis TaxID=1446467 RepID=UPI0012DCD8BD|nr:hypothetical protein [Hymenobacter swuensis]